MGVHHEGLTDLKVIESKQPDSISIEEAKILARKQRQAYW